MSESTDEDFSDSDSDVSQDASSVKNGESLKRKTVQKKNNNDEVDSDSSDEEIKPEPVKKRKTLQDYLSEKVSLDEILLTLKKFCLSITYFFILRLPDKH